MHRWATLMMAGPTVDDGEAMTRYFVTRHTGAVAWAERHGHVFDVYLAHLEPTQTFVAGDVVAGVLPVHLVAELCEQGVVYLNLSLNLPVTLRGQELSADQLEQCEARLEQLVVLRP